MQGDSRGSVIILQNFNLIQADAVSVNPKSFKDSFLSGKACGVTVKGGLPGADQGAFPVRKGFSEKNIFGIFKIELLYMADVDQIRSDSMYHKNLFPDTSAVS